MGHDKDTVADSILLAIEVIKNLFVIITCVAILYLIVQGYLALQDLSDRLEQASTLWGING